MTALHFILGTLMFLAALFLILLILVQRGRGGGLSGALGGMGGESAFGTKAGDVFTRVTMVTATVWILLCMVTIKLLGSGPAEEFPGGGTGIESRAPADPDGAATTPPATTPEAPAEE